MNYSQRPKKSNTYVQFFLILIVYFCCVVKIWNNQQEATGLWVDNLFYFFYAKDYIYKLITSILLSLNAFSMLLFAHRFSLLELRNYYPALLYLLFSFVFAQTLTLWGMIVIFFILWGILPILLGLKEENILANTFIFGLYCGIFSLIYAPLLLLLPYIYIVLFKERFFNIRAFILPLIGTGLVYGYVFAGFYLLNKTDKIPDFFNIIKTQIAGIQFFTMENTEPIFVFFLAVSVLLGGIAFFRIWRKTLSIVINRRKKYVILLIISFFQFAFLPFFHAAQGLFAQIAIVLLTILLFLSLPYVKKIIVYKIIFCTLFVLALTNFLLKL